MLNFEIPRVPVGDAFEWLEEFLSDNFQFIFDAIRDVVGSIVDFVQYLLYNPILYVPIVIALVTAVALTKKFELANKEEDKLKGIYQVVGITVLVAIVTAVLSLFLPSNLMFTIMITILAYNLAGLGVAIFFCSWLVTYS